MGGDKKKGSNGGDFNKHHRMLLTQIEKSQNNRKPEEKAKDEIKLTRTNLWKNQKTFADIKREKRQATKGNQGNLLKGVVICGPKPCEDFRQQFQ